MLIVLHFGGWFGLLVSFGGIMTSGKVEDYKSTTRGSTRRIGGFLYTKKDVNYPKLTEVLDLLEARLLQPSVEKIYRFGLTIGIPAMIVLFCGAQIA